MRVNARKVTQFLVEEFEMSHEEWDSRTEKVWRSNNTEGWRKHMTTLLNQRVKKLVPVCYTPDEFYTQLKKFSEHLGFGEHKAIVAVTEAIYGVEFAGE